MIKKDMSGREHYECSKCGEETTDDAEYCQICGHYFQFMNNEIETNSSVTFELSEDVMEFEGDEDFEEYDLENIKFCILTKVSTYNFSSFAQVKKDITPQMLINHPNSQGIRMFEEPQRNEYFIFKTEYHSILYTGEQLKLNFEYYDCYTTTKGLKLFYNILHFTKSELELVNTYILVV